jgi:hypothetical protein
MMIKLTERHIRAGEERAFELFERKLAKNGNGWIRKDKAMSYRGVGREMVRSVFAMARHIEGAKLSRSLGKRGVDSVSLASVRTALRRVGNALVRIANTRAPRGEAPDGVLSGARAELGRASGTGGRLARWIHRSRSK